MFVYICLPVILFEPVCHITAVFMSGNELFGKDISYDNQNIDWIWCFYKSHILFQDTVYLNL